MTMQVITVHEIRSTAIHTAAITTTEQATEYCILMAYTMLTVPTVMPAVTKITNS